MIGYYQSLHLASRLELFLLPPYPSVHKKGAKPFELYLKLLCKEFIIGQVFLSVKLVSHVCVQGEQHFSRVFSRGEMHVKAYTKFGGANGVG